MSKGAARAATRGVCARAQVVGNNAKVFMVMEFVEHDLKNLMASMKHPFTRSEVKCLMRQLVDGVAFLHENWIVHRDLKVRTAPSLPPSRTRSLAHS